MKFYSFGGENPYAKLATQAIEILRNIPINDDSVIKKVEVLSVNCFAPVEVDSTQGMFYARTNGLSSIPSAVEVSTKIFQQYPYLLVVGKEPLAITVPNDMDFYKSYIDFVIKCENKNINLPEYTRKYLLNKSGVQILKPILVPKNFWDTLKEGLSTYDFSPKKSESNKIFDYLANFFAKEPGNIYLFNKEQITGEHKFISFSEKEKSMPVDTTYNGANYDFI